MWLKQVRSTDIIIAVIFIIEFQKLRRSDIIKKFQHSQIRHYLVVPTYLLNSNKTNHLYKSERLECK
jgi:hypothetical protein